MTGNRERSGYQYSVGSMLRFGETAEEAVVREALEETGVRMKVDCLGFVHENYIFGDNPSNLGKLVYEISFFYMHVPEDFEPVCGSFAESGQQEFLCWIRPDDPVRYYLDFFVRN